MKNIFALVAGIGLILALHTKGHVLREDWLKLWLFAVPAFILAYSLRKELPVRGKGTTRTINPGLILGGITVLAVFSSLMDHKWFYFLDWTREIRSMNDFFRMEITWFVLIATLAGCILATRRIKLSRVILAVLLFSQIACLYQLYAFTGGEPIYRDDHSSFMFRLWEFGATFPQLINYNPFWNGGVAGHYGTASGISGIGLMLWPLWKFFPTHEVYTLGIGLLYIVIAPWLMVLSLRLTGSTKVASYAAGVLGLGVSRYFFLWMLHYGTVAANFATIFIVPAAACVYRVLYLDKREWWTGVILTLSVFFLLAWPPGAIVLACLAPGLLIAWPRFTKKKLAFLTTCALAFLVLYAKNLYIILVHSYTFKHHVVGAVASAGSSSSHQFTFNYEILSKGLHHLWAHVREGHPILIFLGLAGVFFYPSRRLRYWYAPVVLLLLLITAFGKHYFPDLQLRRMSIPMFFAAITPAAWWVGRILCTRGPLLAFLRAALIMLLLMGGWNVSQIYNSRGLAPYAIMQDEIKDLTVWLKDNVPEDGRILFAGATRHKYSRAHVAAWPLFTGRSMMACDYYAFSPKEVEYEYPHKPWRDTPEGTFEFFNTYNVTHIITYRDNWIEFFDAHPDQYEPVYDIAHKQIYVYRVKRDSSMFLEGDGELHATFNRITVALDDPSRDKVIIRMNWEERLQVEEPAELFPYDAGNDVRLIGIRPNGAATVSIRFKSWL